MAAAYIEPNPAVLEERLPNGLIKVDRLSHLVVYNRGVNRIELYESIQKLEDFFDDNKRLRFVKIT